MVKIQNYSHYFSGENEVSDNGEVGDGPDLLSDTPPVPPRRRDRKRQTPPRQISNGLPPTPKVHMGACFSKVCIYHVFLIFLKLSLI